MESETDRLLGAIPDEVWNAVIDNRSALECIRLLRDYLPMLDLASARNLIAKMRRMLNE